MHEQPSTPEPDIEDFDDPVAYAACITPHRGLPLPPDILDTGRVFEAEGYAARAIMAAAEIGKSQNRYLRSDAAIAALAAEEQE